MRVNHSRKNQDPETEIEAKHNDCKTRVLKFISSNIVLSPAYLCSAHSLENKYSYEQWKMIELLLEFT